jgi:rod shape-determining protein MreD
MQWLRFAALVVIVSVLQAGFLDRIALSDFDIKPDLLFILVVFFSICGISEAKKVRSGAWQLDLTEAVIASFTIGLAADIVALPIGPRVLAFGIIGTCLANLHRVLVVRWVAYQAFIIFISSILAYLLVNLLCMLQGQHPFSLRTILWTSLYSAVLGPFLFLPCAWWMGIKTSRFSR